MITKTEFCDIIDKLYKNELFITTINNAFNDINSDNVIYSSGLEETLLKLLELIFNDVESGWIAYWLWELNFGNDYKEGDVTEHDGTIIPLRTAEELYDFLIKNMEDNDENS